MSDNYAVINGKRIELTDEQVKALGIERKNPFERVTKGNVYYNINGNGNVGVYREAGDSMDQDLYDGANYFTDESAAQQVSLHQLLYRKLLKFAYDNEVEDTLEWDGRNAHFVIRYDKERNEFAIDWHKIYKTQEVYFSSAYGAKRAIEEVIKPFMKEHPDFVW